MIGNNLKPSRILSLAITTLAVGCTSINSTSFNNMSSAYRDVVEDYSNNNILLNIVRSSKNMPMSFLDIPSVIGTGNVLTNAAVSTTQGAGTSVTPPSATTGSMGLAVNNGFTFTQASLDNAQFMQSFLKEIPLGVLGFRGTERLLPRAVSYTLLIESVELRSNDSLVHLFSNDPLDPNYGEFQKLLYLLVEAGLTVENIQVKTPLGPAFERAQISKSLDSWGPTAVDGMMKGSLSLDAAKVGGKEMYQLMRNETKTQICVNKYRAKELMGDLLNKSTFCQDSPRWDKSDLNYSNIIKEFTSKYVGVKNLEMVIKIRSPGNVFDFLGGVLNAQYERGESKMVMIKPTISIRDNYNPRYQSARPLFKVYKNSQIADPAVTVSYKGVNYQIADDDDSYTKQVMEFMSTLVTISKIPGAIPASPAVVVR